MKIVIDIPNSLYANLKKIQNGSIACKRILELVRNGTPLPKGHGRLIDADALIPDRDYYEGGGYDAVSCEQIDNVPTIKPKVVVIEPNIVEKLLNSVVDVISKIDWDKAIEAYKERPIDDLSEYSDKLWKKAYERGKAEARPTGEWIGSDGEYQCNKCYEKRWYRSNYCPQCGAMMKEAENECKNDT